VTTKRTQDHLQTAGLPSEGMLQLSLLESVELGSQQPHAAARLTSNTEPEPGRVATRKRRPRAAGGVIECAWCGKPTPIPARGRVPKWCSSSCRHRAWEQRRAAASGLCAVEVVDRTIETVTVHAVVKPEPVTVQVERRPQSASEFASVLLDLAHRLDTGRIYERDLAPLDAPITALLRALLRRRNVGSSRGW
jgi:hypothetical protein